MKNIRVVNPDGRFGNTRISSAETGEDLSGVVSSVSIEIAAAEEPVARLTVLGLSVDMVAQLEGVRLDDDFAEIKVDRSTHRVEILEEDENTVIRIISLKN
jgi:hypothetical protein